MQVLAVDGDILAFRIASVCEEEMAQACDDLVDNKLSEIASDTSIGTMRIYLSGEGNFRYDVAITKPYKGNREGFRKPQHLAHIHDYLRRRYSAITVDGYEADDAIASDMTQNGAIHCGQDKDIYQISGRHYNFVEKEWATVTPEEATLALYQQILTGDKTDNVDGLPRVGVKTAQKIITDPDTAMQDAKAYYKEVCAEKMPDVDVATYWKEQVKLIQLVADLNIADLMTTNIKVNKLRI